MMRQASTLNQRDCPRPMPSVKDVPGHGRGDSPSVSRNSTNRSQVRTARLTPPFLPVGRNQENCIDGIWLKCKDRAGRGRGGTLAVVLPITRSHTLPIQLEICTARAGATCGSFWDNRFAFAGEKPDQVARFLERPRKAACMSPAAAFRRR